ncbi:MAG: HEPN domain-containing protein [Ignavibacteria bacterium]|jgi:HEPN domain-containing protein
MKKPEIIKYWIDSSDRDYITMGHLFEKEDYHWALFIGHLVIEKLLKAYFVTYSDDEPPPIHNLLRLADKAKLRLDEGQKDILVTITTFNIQARYDDYKSAFYKTCTKQYNEKWINEINGLRKWIKKLLLK